MKHYQHDVEPLSKQTQTDGADGPCVYNIVCLQNRGFISHCSHCGQSKKIDVKQVTFAPMVDEEQKPAEKRTFPLQRKGLLASPDLAEESA